MLSLHQVPLRRVTSKPTWLNIRHPHLSLFSCRWQPMSFLCPSSFASLSSFGSHNSSVCLFFCHTGDCFLFSLVSDVWYRLGLGPYSSDLLYHLVGLTISTFMTVNTICTSVLVLSPKPRFVSSIVTMYLHLYICRRIKFNLIQIYSLPSNCSLTPVFLIQVLKFLMPWPIPQHYPWLCIQSSPHF